MAAAEVVMQVRVPVLLLQRWVEGFDLDGVDPAVWSRQPALRRWLTETLAPVDREVADAARAVGALVLGFYEDLGGRVRRVSDDDVGRAADRVQAWFPEVLPLDDAATDRLRALEGLDQPDVVAALFQLVRGPRVPARSPTDRAVVASVAWGVHEVVLAAWRPDAAAMRACIVGLLETYAEGEPSLRPQVDDAIARIAAGEAPGPLLRALGEAKRNFS